ncbi:dual specificity protein phosphatase 22-like [Saccostrea echinata]|uniref:dual specificity protein phosphatase 22-like n=1 Tax=Saccostrea echinata TaxID=191078 RepID=UPI002A82DBCB|nr:dual specificity protein phosphatase 22-like [Saccostrea echinata]
MGNGMNRVLPGLYVGNFRDAKDTNQLKTNNITHILSIHDNAKKLRDDIEYKCIQASDTPNQDLAQFFSECIDFIHVARINGGNVLVHCLAGVSRSVTVTAAYMMTVTDYGWKDCLNAVRGARTYSNPNFGFQKQLQTYYAEKVTMERERIKSTFEPVPYNDNEEMRYLLDAFQKFVLHGDPNRDDGLYSLPHKAYKERPKGINIDSSSEEGSGSHSAELDEESQNNQVSTTQEPNSVGQQPRENQDVLKQNQRCEEPDEDSVNENQKTEEADIEDTVNQNKEPSNISKI